MEGPDDYQRRDPVSRLANGKSAVTVMKALLRISSTWQVPLARLVERSNYAKKFSEDFTGITHIKIAE